MPSPSPVKSWSWSRYKAYKDCPAAFYYDLRATGPKPPMPPAMQRGDTIHLLAEKYAKGVLKAVPAELARFDAQFKEVVKLNPIVEKGWGFNRQWEYIDQPDWFGPATWFRMKADLMIVYEDYTADLIDHKTGQMYDDNEEQVELFAVAGFNRFPHVRHITTRLWYLDLGKEVVEEFNEKQVPSLIAKWERKIKPLFNDRKFAPLPSWRCARCNWSKANGGPCKF